MRPIFKFWLCLVIFLSAQTSWAQQSTADEELEFMDWGPMGSIAYVGLSKVLKTINPHYQPLQGELRELALRYFPEDLVDQVRVHWNSRLNKEVKIGRKVILVAADGQTYGYDVYVVDEDNMRLCNKNEIFKRLRLVLHELVHVQQFYDRQESLKQFGYDYFTAYAAGDYKYENNAMEIAAYAFTKEHKDEIMEHAGNIADDVATQDDTNCTSQQ